MNVVQFAIPHFYSILFKKINKISIKVLHDQFKAYFLSENIYLFIEVSLLLLSSHMDMSSIEDSSFEEVKKFWIDEVSSLKNRLTTINELGEKELEIKKIYQCLKLKQIPGLDMDDFSRALHDEIWDTKDIW